MQIGANDQRFPESIPQLGNKRRPHSIAKALVSSSSVDVKQPVRRLIRLRFEVSYISQFGPWHVV